MEIEKIKNFNQKLLTVFGLMGVLLVAILIVFAITEYVRNLSFSHHHAEAEIISNEKAQENYESNIRTHQVSFESFRLVDTVKKIYLIPVSQSALEINQYITKREKSSKEVLGLLDMNSNYSDFYYDYRSYNNALIYDTRDASVRKLFKSRLSINRINIEKITGKSYILFAVTNKDTNKDNILDGDDSKALFIYSVGDQSLQEITSENTDFVEYVVIPNTDQLVIQYGLDRNKDGKYNWDEPMIMKSYSINDSRLTDLIAPALIDELQNTLDGKK